MAQKRKRRPRYSLPNPKWSSRKTDSTELAESPDRHMIRSPIDGAIVHVLLKEEHQESSEILAYGVWKLVKEEYGFERFTRGAVISTLKGLEKRGIISKSIIERTNSQGLKQETFSYKVSDSLKPEEKEFLKEQGAMLTRHDKKLLKLQKKKNPHGE